MKQPVNSLSALIPWRLSYTGAYRLVKLTCVGIIMLLATQISSAEEYLCEYRWVKKGYWGKKMPLHTIQLKITGNKAVQQLGALRDTYEVIENSKDELILMMKFTKKVSGKNYPAGATLMVLDKKTGVFVLSNTLAVKGKSNHAIGTGKLIRQ